MIQVMAEQHLQLGGEAIDRAQLSAARGREFADLAAEPQVPHVRLIECLKLLGHGREAVIVEMDVEVPQRPVHDIRRTETIAVVFAAFDSAPEVFALRHNFPHVPHINPCEREFPRSLCLSDQPWEERRLTYTARGLLDEIRLWLRDTAQGCLHRDDQPLEGIMMSWGGTLVLPGQLERDVSLLDTLPFRISAIRNGETLLTLIPTAGERDDKSPTEHFLISFKLPPRRHGVLNRLPQNLRELDALLTTNDFNFGHLFAQRLRSMQDQSKLSGLRAAKPICLVGIPKLREDDGESEETEYWAFLLEVSAEDVGKELGIWDKRGEFIVPLIGATAPSSVPDTPIIPLRVVFTLTRTTAARSSGSEAGPVHKCVAVGVGALGSQVLANLVRSGCGQWVLVDEDILLPHNVARHCLTHQAVGLPKAWVMANFLSHVLPDEDVAKGLFSNVLQQGPLFEDVNKALREAHFVLDFSTSVAAARHLALDRGDEKGRRISVFLSPSGNDLVVLAEDSKRAIALDAVEMQYYRILCRTESLATHLEPPQGLVRYSTSCRDVSSKIGQDMVGHHAGIAARILRSVLTSDEASIGLWQTDPSTCETRRFGQGAQPVQRLVVGNWQVVIDRGVIMELERSREMKLPRETGGILFGVVDTARNVVYIADCTDAPNDSLEYPYAFVRGWKGLSEQLEHVRKVTGGQVAYVGEWHSHPKGASCRASKDDRKVIAWIFGEMRLHSLPALMLIVGDDGKYGLHLQDSTDSRSVSKTSQFRIG